MDRLPYKDFTLKARASSLSGYEKILLAAGARYVGSDNQKDTYFKTIRGKLKLRQGNLENLITHYERFDESGIEKTVVYRYDLNPEVEEIQNLFYTHQEIGVIEKERKIYYLDDTKIHLDTKPDQKMFIEIEAIDRTDEIDIDLLRRRCLVVKELLGIKDEDLLKTGYLPF